MKSILCLFATALAVSPARAADLAVHIAGLENGNGNVSLCLWTEASHFPDCSKSPSAQRRVVRANAVDKPILFKELKPGTYALSVLHDENADGRLETNFIGIPKEGLGVSNDALRRFSAPRYDECAFRIEGDSRLTVRLKYY